VSFLGTPQSPNSANKRTIAQAPVASNVLGTPWPTLWGTRDLSGTVIAWTNRSVSSGGGTGKGGGLAAGSGGQATYYRTFALGLCIGPADSITQILYDNQAIWQGNVSIASGNPVSNPTMGLGGVMLSASDGRGTIALYFGTDTQTQDPVLARFVANAPWYRGMVYAVFHGGRAGNTGWRMGNSDTLPQIAIRMTRMAPAPLGLAWTASQSASPGNVQAELQHVTLTLDTSGWTGTGTTMYFLAVQARNLQFDPGAIVQLVAGNDPGFTDGSIDISDVQNGVPFPVGTLGLMACATWPNGSAPIFVEHHGDGWQIQVTSFATSASGGANVAGVIYELCASNIHGFALPPALLDLAAFSSVAAASGNIGLSYAVTEKNDSRSLLTEILRNYQGALTISNGLIGPRLITGSPTGVPAITFEAGDVIGGTVRPGAWYEVPLHVTVKYRDYTRLFRDTLLSLPGAGDVGDDDKNIELDLPMITDASIARLVGTRLRTLQALPKQPDTIIMERSAFVIQFGDGLAINDPPLGYAPGDPWVVVGVREHGVGDERIELDVIPDIFGSLPADSSGLGGGGGGGSLPSQPMQPITVQDAFELPYDFATDQSRRFTVFAARPEPDAAGFSLFASSEPTPVDYDLMDSDALFCAGGSIVANSLTNWTMDYNSYLDFDASSADIDSLTSVSDNGWFGYQMLVLIGSGDGACLYAARELVYLGAGGSSYGRFRLRGLIGPLADTVPNTSGDIWIFALTPPFNVLAEPSWTVGATITFKGITFGSRLSSSLSAAFPAAAAVIARSQLPYPPHTLLANGLGTLFAPSYTTDIALSWILRNRGFGLGYETNPGPFDPTVPSEVTQCDVEIRVAGTLVRTQTVNTRFGTVSTTLGTVTDAGTFDVSSLTGLQAGDQISVVHAGGEWFGRIASISGSTLTLVSPLVVLPSTGDTLNRYESAGYVYDAATNAADNGSLPASLDIQVWPKLNGLRSIRPAELTVTKV
jgi:hypothetical protein